MLNLEGSKNRLSLERPINISGRGDKPNFMSFRDGVVKLKSAQREIKPQISQKRAGLKPQMCQSLWEVLKG